MRPQATPEAIRRWAANLQAAEDRQREEARVEGYTADPIAAGLALIRLAGEHLGWPIPKDDHRRREDEAEREEWSRLRRALRDG